MDTNEIKQTYLKLIVLFMLGLLLLIVGILWHTLGSKRPDPQVYSFFLSLFGGLLTLVSGVKIIKFRKYLKSSSEEVNK